MRKILYYSCFLVLYANVVMSQDIPIDNSLLESSSENFVEKVFPTIQVFNFPVTNVLKKGEMKLLLTHHMGKIGQGIDGMFGMYQANSRVGIDLGLTRNFTVGVGNTSRKKYFDGYLKYRFMKQSSKFPVEISGFTSINYSPVLINLPDPVQESWQRIFYYNSLMISRSINEAFSVQLSFSHIHQNLVNSSLDKNDIFCVGFTGNYKLTRMIYFACEYFYFPLNQIVSEDINNHSLSVGIQIHSGPRHVFQIFLSNSESIIPGTVIFENTNKLKMKNLRFCFNIPTTFRIF